MQRYEEKSIGGRSLVKRIQPVSYWYIKKLQEEKLRIVNKIADLALSENYKENQDEIERLKKILREKETIFWE